MTTFRLIFFLTLLYGNSFASTFHLLMWADTVDTSIAYASKIDLDLVHREAIKIADALGMDATVTMVTGEELNLANVKGSLAKLVADEEDVIFFYYTGHGSRLKEKENIWPDLFLAPTKERIDFNEVKEELLGKGARFVLAIADCCNNFRKAPHKSERGLIAMGGYYNQNMTDLFLGSAKGVFVSASIPGEYAWAYVDEGAVFTLSFIKFFHKMATAKQQVTWPAIFRRIARDIKSFQVPQYEIVSH